MAYKRYVHKKGKKHGPYYYKNVRDHTGKVRTVYLGKVTTRGKKPLEAAIVFLVALLIIISALFFVQNRSLVLSRESAEKNNAPFEADQILIKVLVKENEYVEKELRVMNVGEEEISVTAESSGVFHLASIIDKEFTIKPGQTKIVRINFTSFDKNENVEQEPGVYIGKVIVKTESYQKEIPLIVEIESKNVLFDMNLNPVARDRSIVQGDSTTFEIKVFNLQSVESYNVGMEFFVKDTNSNTIVSEKESVVVQTQASFFKTLRIPEKLKTGNYVFVAQASLGKSVGTASYLFEVESGAEKASRFAGFLGFCKNDPLCWSLSAIILLLIFSIGAYAYFFVGVLIYEKLFGAGIAKKRIEEETQELQISAGKEKNAIVQSFVDFSNWASKWKENRLKKNLEYEKKRIKIEEEKEKLKSEFEERKHKIQEEKNRLLEEKKKQEELREEQRKKQLEEKQKEFIRKQSEENRKRRARERKKLWAERKKKAFGLLHNLGFVKTEQEKKEIEKKRQEEAKLREERRRKQLEEKPRMRGAFGKCRVLIDKGYNALNKNNAWKADRIYAKLLVVYSVLEDESKAEIFRDINSFYKSLLLKKSQINEEARKRKDSLEKERKLREEQMKREAGEKMKLREAEAKRRKGELKKGWQSAKKAGFDALHGLGLIKTEQEKKEIEKKRQEEAKLREEERRRKEEEKIKLQEEKRKQEGSRGKQKGIKAQQERQSQKELEQKKKGEETRLWEGKKKEQEEQNGKQKEEEAGAKLEEERQKRRELEDAKLREAERIRLLEEKKKQEELREEMRKREVEEKRRLEEEKIKLQEEKRKQEEAKRKGREEEKRRIEGESNKPEEEKRKQLEFERKRKDEERQRIEEEQRKKEEEARKQKELKNKKAEQERRKAGEERKKAWEEKRKRQEIVRKQREEQARKKEEEKKRMLEEIKSLEGSLNKKDSEIAKIKAKINAEYESIKPIEKEISGKERDVGGLQNEKSMLFKMYNDGIESRKELSKERENKIAEWKQRYDAKVSEKNQLESEAKQQYENSLKELEDGLEGLSPKEKAEQEKWKKLELKAKSKLEEKEREKEAQEQIKALLEEKKAIEEDIRGKRQSASKGISERDILERQKGINDHIRQHEKELEELKKKRESKESLIEWHKGSIQKLEEEKDKEKIELLDKKKSLGGINYLHSILKIAESIKSPIKKSLREKGKPAEKEAETGKDGKRQKGIFPLFGKEKEKEIAEEHIREQEEIEKHEEKELQKSIENLEEFEQQIPKEEKKPGLIGSILIGKKEKYSEEEERIKTGIAIKRKGKSRRFIKCHKLLINGEGALGKKDVINAKRSYLKAREIYISLEYHEKKDIYNELNELYEKLNKAA